MRTLFALALTSFLAGCGLFQKREPEIKYVPVACLDIQKVPKRPASLDTAIPPDLKDNQTTAVLLGNGVEAKDYALQLEAIVVGCAASQTGFVKPTPR